MSDNPITSLRRRRNSGPGTDATQGSPLHDLIQRSSTRARNTVALIAHSRSTRRAFILRVAIAAACAMFAVSVSRSLDEASDLRTMWGPDVPVLVALVDITPGEVVSQSSVEGQKRPASLVPHGAIRELPDEATATSLILEGDLLVTNRLAEGDRGLAPQGTTAIRLDLAVTAPELTPGDLVDVLGPGDPDGTEPAPDGPSDANPPGSGDRTGLEDDSGVQVRPGWRNSVELISRDAVVLRPASENDPTVEVAVTASDLETVAAAALDGRVVVVRRSP